MRFCIPIPCFFKDLDFCEAVKKVAALGFDAVETYDWTKLDLDAVRNTCLDSGVELLSMCTTEFNMTAPEYRQKWLDGLIESCKAAVKVGAKRLITQVGADTGTERAYQHESIVSGLKAALPVLNEYDVTVMIEPLNVLVDHPGYYLIKSGEAFDIVREVCDSHVKVVYDIYHQQISEGNIIPSVTNNLDCIAHLHSAGHPGRCELQFGESDYKVIFKAIDEAGYTGACGLEYHPWLDSIESLEVFKHIYL